MKYYKAVITEETAPAAIKGQVVANTKSSIQYRGMTKEEFTEATKYISVYEISIIEME